MASNINTTDIDAEYPVAGQDNDSQGFRDNFSTIKDNFIASKQEIEALQDTTAKLDSDNDFNGTVIRDVSFENTTDEVNNIGTVDSQNDINFTNGHYQTITVEDDLTLRLALWPDAGKYGKIRIVLRSDVASESSPRTVTWATEAPGVIKYGEGFPDPLQLSSNTDPVIIDFWTDDGGQSAYAHYLGQFS